MKKFAFLFVLFTLSLACFGARFAGTAPYAHMLKDPPGVDIRGHGAVADDGVDDTAAIIAAEADAYASRSFILIPRGTFQFTSQIPTRVDVVGMGSGSKLLRTGTANNQACLTNFNATSSVSYSGITFRDFEVDGAHLTRGVYASGGADIHVENCVFSNCLSGGVSFYNVSHPVVEKCRISSVRFYLADGDGIYFGGCSSPIARDNQVASVARICIVTEGTTEAKTTNAVIDLNDVSSPRLSDNQAGEYNAGIWVENTTNSTIKNNYVHDISNQDGQSSLRVRGIHIDKNNDATSTATHVVEDNVVDMGETKCTALNIDPGGNSIIHVKGGTIKKGALGIAVSGGREVKLEKPHFEGVSFVSGLIVVGNSSYETTSLVVDNCTYDNCTASTSADTLWAHLSLYEHNYVRSVSLTNLQKWKVLDRQTGLAALVASSTFIANRCSFLLEDPGNSYVSTGRADKVYFTNCSFSPYASVASSVARFHPRDFMNISGCDFYNTSIVFERDASAYASMTSTFSTCFFASSTVFFKDGGSSSLDYKFTDCSFENYDQSPFIGFYTWMTGSHLIVHGGEFRNYGVATYVFDHVVGVATPSIWISDTARGITYTGLASFSLAVDDNNGLAL